MEDQACGGPTPPSYLTEKPTQLPKYSGKKKSEQAIDSALRPLPEKPLFSSRCSGKKAVQAIDEVVSLPSLTMKPPLPPRHSRKKLSGGKRYYEGKSKTFDVQEWPVTYNPLHVEKYPSNRPQLEASWKGSFEILDMVFPGKFCGDFRAHLPQHPCITDDRVHQFSQQMPEVLKFEVLPRCRIWAEIFKSDFALGHDISVYFFPGHFERSIEQYDYLWRFMEKEDSVMRSCMNGVELLVFTSKQLRYAEKLNWISFLWGVFRVAKTECISTSISTNKMSQIHAFGIGTTIKQHSSNSMDEIKSLNDLEVPPGFSRREETKRLHDLEVPPGFSRQEKNKRLIDLEVRPGFSRKDASKAANDAILINFSDLVEVPVESHPALVRSSYYFSRIARRPRSLKKRACRPK